ncbi:glycosyltransferase family 8 protein [Tenacibaculum sp.]|uniref:glycosyltransferase family 8 protein n=1 Tax=Tenacibaculum sp. TaxID=1906242 RepID=UPI003AA80390
MIYNILLTSNDSFSQHCGVCIISLLKNNIKSNFHIVVAGVSLSNESKNNLFKCIEGFNNVQLEIIDFSSERLQPFPLINQYNKDIYLRFWVDEFFGKQEKRVLYIDSDTIVVGDISELFELTYDDFVIGAVDIPFSDSHNRCHLPTEYNYFNSGVLLFNLDAWREGQYRDVLLQFLIDNEEIALNPDQDALNGVLHKQRYSLDYTFNVITPFFRRNSFAKLGDKELKRVRNNAKIVHFNGRARPWYYTCNHPYQKMYFKYLKQSPWKNFRPSDKSFFNLIKKWLRLILRKESFIVMKSLNGE